MLWIFLLFVVLWALGFFAKVAGNLVHVLLVIALIALIYNLTVGRRP